MNYRRAVAYVDYVENGVKIRNGGNVQVEVNGDKCRLYVHIRGIGEADMGIFPIWDDSGRLLGRIELKHGSGSYEGWYQMPQEWSPLQNERLQIILHGDRQLRAVWKGKLPGAAQSQSVMQAAASVSEYARQPAAEPQAEGNLLRRRLEAGELRQCLEETRQKEEPVPYLADKWEQLCHLYPVIHPFPGDQEFLSLAPRDLVVLRKEYQKMVHNSFLLHGYYNYQHLILGKYPEEVYYLGVPGNFYHREKLVAEMFGFEAFESECHPAAPGDFGYYMKRVEL